MVTDGLLNSMDRDDLLLLIADLYDPNDCNLMSNGPGSAPTCVEHNHWEPDENDGRGCPHERARRLLREVVDVTDDPAEPL